MITVAPLGDKSTLWVVSLDYAGNVSTPAGQTFTAGVDKNLASTGHQWPMNKLGTIVTTVPDLNTTPDPTTGTTTTSQKLLQIGAGTNVSAKEKVGSGFLATPVITLPGYLELARYYNGSTDAEFSDGFAPAGYTFDSGLGNANLGQYVPLTAAHTGMTEFYSCALSTGDMTSTSSTCEGKGGTATAMGYLWTSPPTSVPSSTLYRCYIPANGHRFDAVAPTCLGFSLDTVPGSAGGIVGYLAGIAPTVSANTAGSPAVLTPAQAIDTTKSFTVSAWVRLDAANLALGNYTAMSEAGTGPNANSAFYLGKADGGHWRFCIRNQTGTDVVDCAEDPGNATANTWTLITGIWDATNKEVRLLIADSTGTVGVSSTASHVPPPGEVSATSPLVIGSAVTDGSICSQWDGAISNPVAFQGVLASSQLHALATLNPIVDPIS